MRTLMMKQAKRGLLTHVMSKPLNMLQEIKTVTVAVSYTTRSKPNESKGMDFVFDIDKTKDSLSHLFRRGEIDLAVYNYKIIWLNEMGEEQVAYSEDESDRNSRIQALVDDGYSPVWREV